MPNLSVPEMLIIGALLLIFFGKDKLPEAARSLGKSFKALKEEINPNKILTEEKAEKKEQA
jgi:TatA/E family protein of Tat protein translocase